MINVSCTKGKPFYNGVHYYNKAMSDILHQKFGYDWQKRFASELRHQLSGVETIALWKKNNPASVKIATF
jgi:hypothetical protein